MLEQPPSGESFTRVRSERAVNKERGGNSQLHMSGRDPSSHILSPKRNPWSLEILYEMCFNSKDFCRWSLLHDFSILLVKIMLCSKLHCQILFKLKQFRTRSHTVGSEMAVNKERGGVSQLHMSGRDPSSHILSPK